MASSSKRIIGYDITKSLAMFMVLFIHYTFYAGLYPATAFSQALSTATVVGVPLFFMVNGALVLSRPFDMGKHYRKTAGIAVIVIVWEVASALLLGLLTGVNPFAQGIRPFITYVLFGGLEGFNLGYFWFMRALLALYLVLPVIKICFDAPGGKKAVFALALVVFTLVFCKQAIVEAQDAAALQFAFPAINAGGLAELDLFGQYGYTLLYFVMGGLIPYARGLLKGRSARAVVVPACIVFVVAYACLVLVQHYQQQAYGVVFYVRDGYTNIFTLAMTISLFVVFSEVKQLPSKLAALFQSIGSNTLGIYFLHIFPLTALGMYLAPIYGPIESIAFNMVILLLVYAACFTASYVLRRVPFVGRLFKL